MKKSIGSTRPDIADDQGGMQQRLFASTLIAHAYTRYMPIRGKYLHNVAAQANFCSLFKQALLQRTCQCSAAPLHNTRCTVAKHIRGHFDHFRCRYLAEFKAESKTRDTLEESS